jgi:hypothetical protein
VGRTSTFPTWTPGTRPATLGSTLARIPWLRIRRVNDGGDMRREARVRRRRARLGMTGGCFAAALAAIRRWGGVLEHPADSKAWAAFELIAPPHPGGWVAADLLGGWTCRVGQGQYGHAARKATWLYASGTPSLPSLDWRRSAGKVRLDEGFRTTEERRVARAAGVAVRPRMPARSLHLTPPSFRDVLLEVARSARPAP